MSLAILNGERVLRATVSMGLTGGWRMTAEVDTQDAMSGACVLDFGEGIVFRGTIERAGVFVGRLAVHAVGGAGGLSKRLDPRGYRLVDVSVPLADLMADTGEALDAPPPARLLRHWVRVGGPASSALTALATACGLSWRVLPSGKVWIGTPTWAEAKLDPPIDVLSVEPDIRRTVLGVIAPQLLPGTRYRSEAVHYVVHRIEAASMRTEYWAVAA